MPTKTVEIKLDKLRFLRFDVNALADIEVKAGLGLDTLLGEERVGINAIRVLLWGGLRWEDKALTLEAAGNLLQQYIEEGGDLTALGAQVMDAIRNSGLVQSGKKQDAPEETVSPVAS